MVLVNLCLHCRTRCTLHSQLQSTLDLRFGILHAEDNDHTTNYSSFYETFENIAPRRIRPQPEHSNTFPCAKYCATMVHFLRLIYLSNTDYTDIRCTYEPKDVISLANQTRF